MNALQVRLLSATGLVACHLFAFVAFAAPPAGAGDGVIAPVAVEATSSAPECKPEVLIDGSGLREVGTGSGVFVHTSDKFPAQGVTTMWNAGYPEGRDCQKVTLTFDLGKSHAIGSVRVWNFNEAGYDHRGFKEVEVAVSPDGKQFRPVGTFTFDRAPGEPDYAGQFVPFSAPVTGRFFRLQPKSKYGGDVAGLAEICFNTSGAGQPMGKAETVALPVEGPEPRPGYLLAPVRVEASSSQGMSAQNLIDGTGLEETPNGVLVHTSVKYSPAGTTMWNAGYSPKHDYHATLDFELSDAFLIDALRVWNYNEPGYLGRGIKEVEILVSGDGKRFASVGTYTFGKATGEKYYAGEYVVLQRPVTARHVRLAVKSNHQGNDVPGLAETRFNVVGPQADRLKADAEKPFEPKYPRPQHPQLAPGAPLAGAENIVFPDDAGVLDVTKAPFNAKGDGITDDTLALQRALTSHAAGNKIIYVPNGVYLISDRLDWPAGKPGASDYKNTILQGQSRRGAVIKLKDACSGYTNPRKPKAMAYTGPAPAQRFRNAIRNLTFDSGVGNPGAIGVQFHANNQGTCRDVTIVSGDGQGRIGLDMSYTAEIGPLLVKNLTVQGFDVGIKTAHGVNSMTLEFVTLVDQNEVGLRNEGQPLSVRGLTTQGDVIALDNVAGLVVLLDGEFHGSEKTAELPAVRNRGGMYARNLRATGFRQVLANAGGHGQSPPGNTVAEFASQEAVSLFPSPSGHLQLPVRDTPTLPWDPPEQWVSPTHFGAVPDDQQDDSEAVQRVIDSGKTTLYFPNGHYDLKRTVLVRGNVRRIIGCEAWVTVPTMADGGPGFKIVDGTSPTVVIERISCGYGRTPTVENASGRTLVLQHSCNLCANLTGPGDLFIEDCCSNPFTNWQIRGQNVWARQFNPENEGTHVINEGGSLWILGLKTERGGTLVDTHNGGRTEVLGGFAYTTTDPADSPMFRCHRSQLSYTFAEACFTGKPYRILVEEARNGVTRHRRAADGSASTTTVLYSGSAVPTDRRTTNPNNRESREK